MTLKNRKQLFLFGLILLLFGSCASQFNKGITNKKTLRSKKPPSVRIQEEYDQAAKRANRGTRKIHNKEGKALDKALRKRKEKKLKKDQRYLKKRKKLSKNK